MSTPTVVAFVLLMIAAMPNQVALTVGVSCAFLVAAWWASGWFASPTDLQIHDALERTRTVLGELEGSQHDCAARSNS